MNRRRGVSLIEMLVAIEFGAVVLSLAVGLLYTLFQVQGGSRQRLAAGQTVDRLAEQFRRDVRAAANVTPAQGDAKAALTLAVASDRSIEYRLKDNVVLRTEQAGQRVSRREEYRLPPGGEVRWETAPDRKPLVSLLISAAFQAGKDRPIKTLKIDAALGADSRYTSPKE